MGELRRIVCQKKYLLAVFVLLIANLFLFQYYQMDNLQALRGAHVNVLDIIGIVPSRQFITKLLTGRGFLSFRIGAFIRSLLHRSCRPEPPSAPPRSGSHKVWPEQNHQA